jgi:uncharacterized membrane protein HdeD (DUF308 family)
MPGSSNADGPRSSPVSVAIYRNPLGPLAQTWPLWEVRGVLWLLFALSAVVLGRISAAALVPALGAFGVCDGACGLLLAWRLTGVFRYWWAVLVEGSLSLIVGIVALAWPPLIAVALVYLFAAWAIATGVLALAAAAKFRSVPPSAVPLAIVGIVSIAVGIAVASDARLSFAVVAYLIAFYALITGLGLLLVGRRIRWLA